MMDLVRMVVVLTVICGTCALALSGFRTLTAERIETQFLVNVEGPKVEALLAGSDNDLIADRRTVAIDGQERVVFVGKREGQPWAIAYETVGQGFGGDIVVMVGYDIRSDTLTGIEIVSHKETPGIGSKITMQEYRRAFAGLPVSTDFRLEQDGGEIDAVSGATYSSRGRCHAVEESKRVYSQIKQAVLQPS